MIWLLRSLKSQASPLRTATFLAFVLLLSACGKQSPRPTIYLESGTPNPTSTEAPTEEELLDDQALEREEKAIDAALQSEAPNEEMSRDTFLKLIEKAKTAVQTKTATPEEKTPVDPAKESTPSTSPSPVPSRSPSPTPTSIPSPSPSPAPAEERKTSLWPSLNKTPRTKPSPQPQPLPLPTTPAKKPEPAPAPLPPAPTTPTDANDVGIDEEDEVASTQYSGPKAVVDRPKSTPYFQLSEIAANLGSMKTAEYRRIQIDTMKTAYRACNFFLITALVEANVVEKTDPPLFMAAAFDDHYFVPTGWKKISVETMKKWFRDGKSFDVVLQRDAPKGKNHGHVAIPVGLNAAGQVMVAEGVYQKVSNRIRVYSDKEIATKFRIFARYE